MENKEVVQKAFAQQADRFGDKAMTLANQEYLQWMVRGMDLRPDYQVLDVAAGTGLLSRAIAPHVQQLIAIDATLEMLWRGKSETEQSRISNISFQQGYAENLPYADNSFDLVVCRFAIHHFASPFRQIKEMTRVCRHGGKVAVIDLVSPSDEELAPIYNHFERLRDPSHVNALSPAELQKLLANAGLAVSRVESRDVEVNVERWLTLTRTEETTRDLIAVELMKEIDGGSRTGMRPFKRDHELMFLQTWVMAIGEKFAA